MAEKIIILGMAKTPYRSVYTFSKDEKFLKFFNNFLEEFDLEYLEVENDNISYAIERNKDSYYNINGVSYDVDVFIGGEEIVLVIRTKGDKQQIISDKMFKLVEFKE